MGIESFEGPSCIFYIAFRRTSMSLLPSMLFSPLPCEYTDPCAASSRDHHLLSSPSRTSQRSLPSSSLSRQRRTMSGFLSSEAEQALQAEEAEAQRLYEAMVRNQQQARGQYPHSSGSTYPSTNRGGVPYIQQPTWNTAYPSSTMAHYPSISTPVVPSSPAYM